MSKLKRALEMTAGSERGAEASINKLRGAVECACGCSVKLKKETLVCQDCSGVFCRNHVYIFAVVLGSPHLCASCSQKRYGVEVFVRPE